VISPNPLVSVVIPAFNCASFISETLEGVYQQTYVNWEIVVIDDGSTDDTKSALEPHMHRIRYFYQENKGTAAARNAGIQRARGEFVAFLDNDDYWVPEKLDLQVRALQAHPDCGLVFSDGKEIAGSTILRDSLMAKRLHHWVNQRGDQESRATHGWLFNELIMENLIYSVSGVMVRKISVEKIGGFDESITIADDYDFYLRLTQLYPVAFLQACLYIWRYRKDSQSGPKESRNYRWGKAMIQVLEKNSRIIPSEFETQVRKRLQDMYWQIGWQEFNQARLHDSRQMFLACLRHNWFFMPAVLSLFASYLSPSFVKKIRDVKQQLTSTLHQIKDS